MNILFLRIINLIDVTENQILHLITVIARRLV
jgi:hypothetical protein